MNKQRRKLIDAAVAKLTELRMEVEAIAEDEEEYRDAIPENLAASEVYDKADDAAGSLRLAADGLGDAIDYLEEAAQ